MYFENKTKNSNLYNFNNKNITNKKLDIKQNIKNFKFERNNQNVQKNKKYEIKASNNKTDIFNKNNIYKNNAFIEPKIAKNNKINEQYSNNNKLNIQKIKELKDKNVKNNLYNIANKSKIKQFNNKDNLLQNNYTKEMPIYNQDLFEEKKDKDNAPINEISYNKKQKEFFEKEDKILITNTINEYESKNNIDNPLEKLNEKRRDINNINEYIQINNQNNLYKNNIIRLNEIDYNNNNNSNKSQKEFPKDIEINVLNKCEQNVNLENPFEDEDYKKSKLDNIKDFGQINFMDNLIDNNDYFNKEIENDKKVNKDDNRLNNYIINENVKENKIEVNNEYEQKNIEQRNISDMIELNNDKIKENEKEKGEDKKYEKEPIKVKENEENQKIYGFINRGNNCYLNASLQLLTRIKELKEEILKFNDICNDIKTNGKLIIEFKNILNQIDNCQSEINPDKLKSIINEIDENNDNNQQDANEFISKFINEIFAETANKENIELKIKKLEMDNEIEKKAYDNFFKKFYMKKGYSFILELFYGIIRVEKYCKNCKKINSIKFNAYNMLELPIYELANQNKMKIFMQY